MNQVDQVINQLKNESNLEWINTGRVSDDWKAKIFGHKITKRQIGIYKRNAILVRLEKYDTDIIGVAKYPKIPKGDSWEASFSRFKDGKGICVVVDTVESFKNLLDWYFSDNQN
ncbi:MAG: hypothetical protein PHG00_09390 [Methylococcales bacterium]|nr:hypothetical protein [Methylococcales bacterium]